VDVVETGIGGRRRETAGATGLGGRERVVSENRVALPSTTTVTLPSPSRNTEMELTLVRGAMVDPP